jgi:hypothetical protein
MWKQQAVETLAQAALDETTTQPSRSKQCCMHSTTAPTGVAALLTNINKHYATNMVQGYAYLET